MTPSVARHATITALTAVTLDWAYSITFWLVLGRDERRKGPYAELKYFALIGQLSLETAAIAYLVGQLRKTGR